MEVMLASGFAELYPQVCPHEIKTTPMRMKGSQLMLLYWRNRVEQVQRLLPKGLTVETYDDSGWVGWLHELHRVVDHHACGYRTHGRVLVPSRIIVDTPGLPVMWRWLYFQKLTFVPIFGGIPGKPGMCPFVWSLVVAGCCDRLYRDALTSTSQ